MLNQDEQDKVSQKYRNIVESFEEKWNQVFPELKNKGVIYGKYNYQNEIVFIRANTIESFKKLLEKANEHLLEKIDENTSS